MKKLLIIILLSALLIACTNASADSITEPGDNDKLTVVTTIFPVYDFARAVTGGQAELIMLVPPGASIHSYEPSIADIEKIRTGDVFICIGEGEHWLNNLDLNSTAALRLSEHIDLLKHHSGHYDEHIWTCPVNAAVMVDIIASALIEADSDNSEAYRANADSYIEKLLELDNAFSEIISSAERSKIIVADRFPLLYFAQRYGLEYEAAFHSCSDQSDASLATVVRLTDTVIAEKHNFIFQFELSGGNTAAIIADETGAQILQLHSCQNVTREEFDSGETYLSLMQENAVTLNMGLNQ